MVTEVRKNRQTLADYGDKYIGPVLVGFISENTPPDIRLMRLMADFGPIADVKKKDKALKKHLLLEGVVFGQRMAFESSLAGYLVKLKKSPLFGQATVLRRTVDMLEGKEVMNISVQLELI